MLAVANALFFVFHTALILFNVFGWISKRWRRWNPIALLLTAASWGLMGIRYGMGYCVCTDLHWQVRRAMGIDERSDSYLILLAKSLTGWTPPTALANAVALATFLGSAAISLTLNYRDWRQQRDVDASIGRSDLSA